MAIGMCMKPCLHTGQVGPALAGWAGFSWLGWLCLLSLVALIFGGMKKHCTGYINTCPPFTSQVKFGDLALLSAGILATNNSDILASLVAFGLG